MVRVCVAGKTVWSPHTDSPYLSALATCFPITRSYTNHQITSADLAVGQIPRSTEHISGMFVYLFLSFLVKVAKIVILTKNNIISTTMSIVLIVSFQRWNTYNLRCPPFLNSRSALWSGGGGLRRPGVLVE